jgi:hypothetical protein
VKKVEKRENAKEEGRKKKGKRKMEVQRATYIDEEQKVKPMEDKLIFYVTGGKNLAIFEGKGENMVAGPKYGTMGLYVRLHL